MFALCEELGNGQIAPNQTALLPMPIGCLREIFVDAS
jgi:hypothetical protein